MKGQLLYSLTELFKILLEEFSEGTEDGGLIIKLPPAVVHQVKASIEICEGELSKKKFAEAIFSDKHHPLS